MFHIQVLLGLVMAVFMATASAVGPSDLDIPQSSGPTFVIESFTTAFKNNLNNTIVSDFQTTLTDYTVSVFAYLSSALDYKFVVSGNVMDTSGGNHGGILQAVSVPEPKGWMSLVSGLGLVGLKLGRFKRRMY